MYKLYVSSINGNYDMEGEYDGIVYKTRSEADLAKMLAEAKAEKEGSQITINVVEVWS